AAGLPRRGARLSAPDAARRPKWTRRAGTGPRAELPAGGAAGRAGGAPRRGPVPRGRAGAAPRARLSALSAPRPDRRRRAGARDAGTGTRGAARGPSGGGAARTGAVAAAPRASPGAARREDGAPARRREPGGTAARRRRARDAPR